MNLRPKFVFRRPLKAATKQSSHCGCHVSPAVPGITYISQQLDQRCTLYGEHGVPAFADIYFILILLLFFRASADAFLKLKSCFSDGGQADTRMKSCRGAKGFQGTPQAIRRFPQYGEGLSWTLNRGCYCLALLSWNVELQIVNYSCSWATDPRETDSDIREFLRLISPWFVLAKMNQPEPPDRPHYQKIR